MRTYFAVLLAVAGAALQVVTVGAYFLATICLDYCEPEDEPTVRDGLELSLPFALATLAATTAAARLFMTPRGSWPRALLVAVGALAVSGLVLAAFAEWYDDMPSAGVAAAACLAAWVALVGVAARAATP